MAWSLLNSVRSHFSLPREGDVAWYWMRLLLQILLLAIFHNFFGLPAIEKYHKKEVYLVNTLRNTEGIPLPAITLAFSEDAPENKQFQSCYLVNTSFVDCLERNAPNSTTIIKKVMRGSSGMKAIALGENEIIKDLAWSSDGPFFTLNLDLTIGPDYDEDQIFLFLSPTIVRLSLHDPKFFINNENPYGLPGASQVIDATSATTFRNILKICSVTICDKISWTPPSTLFLVYLTLF